MARVKFLVEVKVTQYYVLEFEDAWGEMPGDKARQRIEAKARRQIREKYALPENADVSADIIQETISD